MLSFGKWETKIKNPIATTLPQGTHQQNCINLNQILLSYIDEFMMGIGEVSMAKLRPNKEQ